MLAAVVHRLEDDARIIFVRDDAKIEEKIVQQPRNKDALICNV